MTFTILPFWLGFIQGFIAGIVALSVFTVWLSNRAEKAEKKASDRTK